MRLYLATNNPHKVQEFSRMMGARERIGIRSAESLGGMPEVEETAETFQGNAELKAKALWEKAEGKVWTLADDSGLEVDALGGRPGVYSARYAGDGAGDAANRRKLLDEMQGVPEGKRGARFVCVLALIRDAGEAKFFRGTCEGTIAFAEEGEGGFGYDPIFLPLGRSLTFASVPATEKDELSHRGKAIGQLAGFLIAEE